MPTRAGLRLRWWPHSLRHFAIDWTVPPVQNANEACALIVTSARKTVWALGQMRPSMAFWAYTYTAVAVALLACEAARARDTSPVQVWVSPTDGDDSAAGTSPEAPLRHLKAARDRVRALRGGAGGHWAATVWLMAGTHRLNETLNLTQADSHTSYRAASQHGAYRGSGDLSKGLPVISGGRELSWTHASGGEVSPGPPPGPCRLLRAAVAPSLPASAGGGGVYPELYLADPQTPRATVSRLPLGAIANPDAFYEWEPLTPATASAFRYVGTQPSPEDWGTDATAFVATAPWGFRPARIAHVSNLTVTLRDTLGPKPLTKSSAGQGKRRWCVLNNQRGPLLSGEYRYSSTRREIEFNYCLNASDSDAASSSRQLQMPVATVALPGLTTLVSVQDGAVGVSFEWLQFSHSAVGPNPSPFSYDAPSTGAVEVSNATQTQLNNCAFVSIGANAIQIRHGVKGVAVSGCVFRDIGGRGFSTTLEHTGSPQDAADVLVVDSVFQGCGTMMAH